MVIFLSIVIFLLLVLLVGHGMVIRKLHRDLSYRERDLAIYRVWVAKLLQESPAHQEFKKALGEAMSLGRNKNA